MSSVLHHVPGPEVSDQEVIARVVAGDTAAYEAIMRRYNRLLFRLARGIVGNDEDARDTVQETYVRAYYRLSQFRGPAGFGSWLSRIAINEALGRLRSRKTPTDDLTDPEDLATMAALEPENLAMSGDVMRFVEAAIDRLPQDFRVVFMLRGVEQLSTAETAAHLGIKPATVKTRFHRARLALRKHLSRQLRDITASTFPFDGARCDAIVTNVFAQLSRGDAIGQAPSDRS